MIAFCVLCSFYAEVNALSKDGGKAHWIKIFQSVVQMQARQCQVIVIYHIDCV